MGLNINSNTYIAPTAVIIGNVEINEGVSVWDGAVIRGDLEKIVIGKNTNIQDNVVIHVSRTNSTIIGENTSIGHLAMVHGSKIGNNVMIGIGSVILDGSEVGDGSIVGAGAIVTSNMKVPPKSLVVGVPGKVIRAGEDIEETAIENGLVYQKLRDLHKAQKFERYRRV